MYTQRQLKRQHFNQILPLLDRDFDEKKSETFSDYNDFCDQQNDETPYIMEFEDQAETIES